MKRKRIIATAILILSLCGYLLVYCFWSLQIQQTPSLKIWLPLDRVPYVFIGIAVFCVYCLSIIDFNSKKGTIKDEKDLCTKNGHWFIIREVVESIDSLCESSKFRLYCLQEIDKRGNRIGEKTWYHLRTVFVFRQNPPELKTIYEISVFAPDSDSPSVQLLKRDNKIIH